MCGGWPINFRTILITWEIINDVCMCVRKTFIELLASIAQELVLRLKERIVL